VGKATGSYPFEERPLRRLPVYNPSYAAAPMSKWVSRELGCVLNHRERLVPPVVLAPNFQW